MNEWSIKTLQVVKEQNYLDRLQEIYPHEEGEQDVAKNILESIKKSFETKDELTLLNQLLSLKKFPYKDSYVAFLRKDRTAIERNPKTVRRICDRLYEMGIEDIINGVTQPKEANRRRGTQFRTWAKRNFRWVKLEKFKQSTEGIVMLDATELEAKNFCNVDLGIGITKRPDIVAKSSKWYVVGEAKFLSATGGNQKGGFDDGMALATKDTGNAYKVFVLDGVHWIETGSGPYKRIEYGNAAVFSALLLNDYLQGLA